MKYPQVKKVVGLILFLITIVLLQPRPARLAEAPARQAVTADLSQQLRGRILLQVQSHGEAWLVHPLNYQRYYLGRPTDAFNLMRALGLGVSNRDLQNFGNYAPNRLAGRILLQVEDKGQAYYVNPLNLKLYYLGRPTDAFNLMRSLGLGISTADLQTIAIGNLSGSADSSGSDQSIIAYTHQYVWTYQGKNYTLGLNLSEPLYESYTQSPKSYTYYGQLPTDWQEQYYAMFLAPKTGDQTVKTIVQKLTTAAANNNLTNDQLVELTAALVQSIPYDKNKNLQDEANYPYEALYTKLGVCQDKTFLLVQLLRELGYGAAVFDFDAVNHAAAGVACPAAFDAFDSGYCYVETTNSFPIGVTPQKIDGVVATNIGLKNYQGQFDNVFVTDQLGPVTILQKTIGSGYNGSQAVHDKVDKLKALEKSFSADQQTIADLKIIADQKLAAANSLKSQLDQELAAENYAGYNQLVPQYNIAVNDYNAAVNNYKLKTDTYNANVQLYNQLVEDFYK